VLGVQRVSFTEQGWSPVVELRQYTLRPGMRDVLIELFDARFVESQEDVGMQVIGQFRDLERPDRFVWLRGFPDMDERARSLTEFYGGPIWKRNREAANATMINTDDVLLLRPARPGSAFELGDRRACDDDDERAPVAAAIFHLGDAAAGTGFASSFERSIAPGLDAADGSLLASFVTEPAENTFPSLPVRQAENVFVAFFGYADRDGLERGAAELERLARDAPELARPPELLRLAPTSRSLLDGRAARMAVTVQTGNARREE
jgi:hypothetical protein